MDCKYKAQGCGGCEGCWEAYSAQLEEKNARVRGLLSRFGEVMPVIGMESPEHYRCKVISTFGESRGKKLISGLYKAGTHKVIPVADCVLENREAAKTVECVRKAAAACHYPPFDEDEGYGMVRHVMVRRGYYTNQTMVVLVTAHDILPGSKNFVKELLRLDSSVTTVVQNVNDRRTSAVFGEKTKTLYGKGFIEDELCGCRFIISPLSFYQVNPVQTQTLYKTAIEFAGLTGGETVLDAYCGTGTIGIAAAKNGAKSVIGVEQNRAAVGDAVKNARRNKLSNTEFFCGDAGEFMQASSARGERADIVFMDPPRTGSDERFLSALCDMSPVRVVYVSCNVETLARDLEYLTRHGYKVKKMQPVDMFPFTRHIECVALLTRENA